MLPDLHLANIFDTSKSDLIADFFAPALTASVRYDRGVGYFSSGWFRIAAAGMVAFAENGGRARWVTSPILDPDDWEAMQRGDAARTDEVLLASIRISLDDMKAALTGETRSALAWMVADGILDFRLALPRAKLDQGDFHDKFGIFTDSAGQQISFNGSYNDSIQGTRNYESIKVFPSWVEAFAPLVAADHQRFDSLWNNLDPNVCVYRLPDAARHHILQLRDGERPYQKPPWADTDDNNNSGHDNVGMTSDKWRHQQEAIAAFLKYRQGVLEMATGTGKTRTALDIIRQLVTDGSVETVIVAADGTDLLDQWYSQLVQLAMSLKPRFSVVRHYAEHHDRDKYLLNWSRTILLVSRPSLPYVLRNLDEAISRQTILIHDEVHRLGSNHNRSTLRGLSETISYRLGLSATPDREYDVEGNHFIEEHIGPVLFDFGLEDAIRNRILSPFNYFPIEYVPDENDKSRLQQVYRKQAARRDSGNPMSQEEVWIDIARVYKTSLAKLPLFQEFIACRADILKRCIIFVETREYGEKVLPLIHEHRFDFHTYYAEDDRDTLLAFARGEIQCLITCHRISEGIDIRSLENVILFSSSRARLETIQRMGRCLRSDPTKPEKRANIVDFIRHSSTTDLGTERDSADEARRQWLFGLSKISPEDC